MSLRDRRRMGVTFLSVLRVTKELVNDSEFQASSTREMSERILEKIISRNLPEARVNEPGIDWDGLLAFIEALLPIILQLLMVFA